MTKRAGFATADVYGEIMLTPVSSLLKIISWEQTRKYLFHMIKWKSLLNPPLLPTLPSHSQIYRNVFDALQKQDWQVRKRGQGKWQYSARN